MTPIGPPLVAASLASLIIAQAPAARLQTRASTPTEALVTHPRVNAVHDVVREQFRSTPVSFAEPVSTRRPSPARAAAGPAYADATRPHPHSIGIAIAAPVRRDWLISGDGTLKTRVVWYTDCSGASELTHDSAAIDTCIPGPTYFVGHNAGVFAPLMHFGVGSVITYYDGGGVPHVWRVVSVRPGWRAADGAPPPTQPDVVAQFQTCAVPNGSVDRILDVVPA